MNFILVVLQVTAVYSGATMYGWTPIGEFQTEEACVTASKQLVDANKDRTVSGIRRFICVRK